MSTCIPLAVHSKDETRFEGTFSEFYVMELQHPGQLSADFLAYGDGIYSPAATWEIDYDEEVFSCNIENRTWGEGASLKSITDHSFTTEAEEGLLNNCSILAYVTLYIKDDAPAGSTSVKMTLYDGQGKELASSTYETTIVCHDYHEYVRTVEPTGEEEDGYTVYQCDCGKVVHTNIIPAVYDLFRLELPKNLARIEQEAFANSACEAVIIPEGCLYIGSGAFRNCKKLEYVYLPHSIVYISDSAFEGCSSAVFYGKDYTQN